jgi:hypothetical protein
LFAPFIRGNIKQASIRAARPPLAACGLPLSSALPIISSEDTPMKNLFTVCAAACFATSALAAGPEAASAPKSAQQSKMTSCNADAAGKKGDERKAFMKDCLSAKPAAAAPAPVTQQSKMKTCNADAKDMKGDARKDFMKGCLSGAK